MFYELVKLKHFRSTFEIDNNRCKISLNFCCTTNDNILCNIANNNFYVPYLSCWLLYLLVRLTTFSPTILYASLQITNLIYIVKSIIMDFFGQQHCIWQLWFANFFYKPFFYASLKIFMNYLNAEQVFALSQWTRLMYTIAMVVIDDF